MLEFAMLMIALSIGLVALSFHPTLSMAREGIITFLILLSLLILGVTVGAIVLGVHGLA